MDLKQVQAEQAFFDAVHWSHEPGAETIGHSERHITKLAGKLATIAERLDHGEEPDLTQLDTEVIPDLLIFAARLANERRLSLNAVYPKRTQELRDRFSHPG